MFERPVSTVMSIFNVACSAENVITYRGHGLLFSHLVVTLPAKRTNIRMLECQVL